MDLRPVEVLWDGDEVPPGKDIRPMEVLWEGDGTPKESHVTSGSIIGWYLMSYFVRWR